MCSLITPYIPKFYRNVDELQDNFSLYKNKINVLGGSLYEGYIHSVYVKIEYDDYAKIYNYYNDHNLLSSQSYNMYSNNKLGVLCYYDNVRYEKSSEKWDFMPSGSNVYNYKTADVAYCIDKFENRRFLEMSKLNDVSLRFNSYGNWCNLDCKVSMFLGSRLIYNHHERDLEFINATDRRINNCVNLTPVSAKAFMNIYTSLEVQTDLYVMFRSVNRNKFNFSKFDIKEFLQKQKLHHLIDQKCNLLEIF